MLAEILSQKACAECRICCTFDNYDIWETPVISPRAKELILSIKPNQEFTSYKGSYLFKMEKRPSDELFYCPMLSEDGCMMGEKKPFDCNIWPFRVMDFGGEKVITLSPVCPNLIHRSLSELIEFLENGLAESIFDKANRSPAIIKPYIFGYPILATEK